MEEETFLDGKYFKRTKRFLQDKKFPNAPEVTWYNFFTNLLNKIITYDLDQRATSVAYGFTLASFPAIIFLFTLIPYFPIEDLHAQIMGFLKEAMPEGIYSAAEQTIFDIITRQRADVLSFGFLLTLYAATSGMVSLMRSFNIFDKGGDKRSFLAMRGTALMLTFMMTITIVVAIVLVIVGRFVMDFLVGQQQGLLNFMATHHMENIAGHLLIKDSWIVSLLNILRYLISFVALAAGVAIIYYFAPYRRLPLHFFNLGVTISSGLIVLSTYAFSYYLSNLSSYNKLYGSIGTLIAYMLWLYLISLLLILGYEINSCIVDAKRDVRQRKKVLKAKPTNRQG